MVGRWPHEPFTFRALKATLGQMWIRCDLCRRYAPLRIGSSLMDIDYRTRTFSCSACGAEAYWCAVEPIRETGMADYRLDERTSPERHPDAVRRLTRPPRLSRAVAGGGELPGRKIDLRR